MMKKALGQVIVLACMLLASNSYGQIAEGKCGLISRTDSAEILFDKTVNKMVVKDHYLYAGGSFGTVGKFSGSFIQINKQNGAAVNRREWSKVVGNINGSIPDGRGGLVVYGAIKSVGDSTRNGIAIVDKNGIVTPFKITIDNTITSAVVVSGILYIGGYFTNINGQTRNRLAAINIITGDLTSWNPDIKNMGPLRCRVECMTESNGVLYIGGAFSHVGTTLRKNIAALNITTGAVTSWDPGAYFETAPDYGNVSGMLKVNNMLYICGGFDYAGGSKHPDIAAIDITSAIAASWKPDPNSAVFSLANKGDTLYLGGAFYEIGGQQRYSFAAYSISTGNLLPVIMDTKVRVLDQVNTILPLGDTLYVGGTFDTIKNQCRKNIASFNRSTGDILSFTSHTNGSVKSLLYDNNKLYIGGDFISVGRKLRNYLAAIDLEADTVADWYPKVNDVVTGLYLINDLMYITGSFTKLNDSVRHYSGALNTKNWTVGKWNPKTNLGRSDIGIKDIVAYKDAMYIAGDFDTVAGQLRNGIARMDTLGNLHPWVGIKAIGSKVNDIDVYKDTLYACGNFKDLGGQYRECVGALNLNTGLATPWMLANSDTARFEILEANAMTLLSGGGLLIAYEKYIKPVTLLTVAENVRFLEYYIIGTPSSGTIWSRYDGSINTIATGPKGIYVMGTFNKAFVMFIPGATGYTREYLNPAITLDDTRTIAMSGNKVFLGGTFSNRSLGYLNAAMFLDPKVFWPSILLTDSSSLCKGRQAVLHLQTTTMYGAEYKWFLNGKRIGNASPYYTYTPSNNDSISCIVSDQPNICRWDTWDTSNTIVFKVMPIVTPDITINGPVEEEPGKTVTIKAVIKDADTGYTIEWFNRGVSLGKTKTDSISYVKGTGKDSIYAVITPRTDTCYVTDTSSLIVVGEKEEVGIHSAKGGDERVMIYPNPFDTYVKIKGVEQDDVLLLYDVMGRKMSSTIMNNLGSEYLIPTTTLRTGTYTLKLTNKEGITRKTMLLQKQ